MAKQGLSFRGTINNTTWSGSWYANKNVKKNGETIKIHSEIHLSASGGSKVYDWEVTTEGWKTAGKGREATLPDAKYAAVEALNNWYSS